MIQILDRLSNQVNAIEQPLDLNDLGQDLMFEEYLTVSQEEIISFK